jgi:RNA polymerase sigma factor (sigma-70 family)
VRTISLSPLFFDMNEKFKKYAIIFVTKFIFLRLTDERKRGVMISMDYEKLYTSYYMQIYSYVVSIAQNRELAEEITQKTFYKAISAKTKFKGRSNELTWLCSIAKNLYYDELRKNQHIADMSEISDLPSDENIERTVSDSDMAFRIHLVLHRLDEPYKEVFQLRVFGELSFAQIATIFGKTETWARVTYHRAKLKIQEGIGEKHE